jgi:hypothetical protein
MADVLVTIALEPKAPDQWRYTLTFEIPTVVSNDGRYFLIAPEIRSDRTLFDVSLNVKKPVSVEQQLNYPPNSPGIPIPYVKTDAFYGDQYGAEKVAGSERDNADQILRTISNLNNSVPSPIVQTLTYP